MVSLYLHDMKGRCLNNLRGMLSCYTMPARFSEVLRGHVSGPCTEFRFIDLVHVSLKDAERDGYKSEISVEVYTFTASVREHPVQPLTMAVAPGKDDIGLHANGVWDYDYILGSLRVTRGKLEEFRKHGWNKCYSSILCAMYPLMNKDETGFDLSAIPILQLEEL